jgi:hypothetical protein
MDGHHTVTINCCNYVGNKSDSIFKIPKGFISSAQTPSLASIHRRQIKQVSAANLVLMGSPDPSGPSLGHLESQSSMARRKGKAETEGKKHNGNSSGGIPSQSQGLTPGRRICPAKSQEACRGKDRRGGTKSGWNLPDTLSPQA